MDIYIYLNMDNVFQLMDNLICSGYYNIYIYVIILYI